MGGGTARGRRGRPVRLRGEGRRALSPTGRRGSTPSPRREEAGSPLKTPQRGLACIERQIEDGAIRDYEAALRVIDYPAVRDLLREAKELRAGK